MVEPQEVSGAAETEAKRADRSRVIRQTQKIRAEHIAKLDLKKSP